jgi:hypothetical protein
VTGRDSLPSRPTRPVAGVSLNSATANLPTRRSTKPAFRATSPPRITTLFSSVTHLNVTPLKKGARMSTIHLHQTTTSTPEQYVAGLTDFGPGRSKLFGNSADEGARPGPLAGRRHRRLGRHLGTPALRLVRSQPRRPQDDRLQHVGRRVGAHLQLHASAQRHDRH